MKKFFNKIWRFFCRIWMVLLGLKTSDSVKTFSPIERRRFFEGLGVVPFVLCIVLLFTLGLFVNPLLDSEVLGYLILVSVFIFIILCVVKFAWHEEGPVKSSKREAEGCEFHKYKKENDDAVYGFITYKNLAHNVEDFTLTNEGKDLLSLNFEIFNDEESGKIVRIYYDEHEKKFVESTEVRDEVYKSYEISSWIFFAGCLLVDLTLVIGTLIIIF